MSSPAESAAGPTGPVAVTVGSPLAAVLVVGFAVAARALGPGRVRRSRAVQAFLAAELGTVLTQLDEALGPDGDALVCGGPGVGSRLGREVYAALDAVLGQGGVAEPPPRRPRRGTPLLRRSRSRVLLLRCRRLAGIAVAETLNALGSLLVAQLQVLPGTGAFALLAWASPGPMTWVHWTVIAGVDLLVTLGKLAEDPYLPALDLRVPRWLDAASRTLEAACPPSSWRPAGPSTSSVRDAVAELLQRACERTDGLSPVLDALRAAAGAVGDDGVLRLGDVVVATAAPVMLKTEPTGRRAGTRRRLHASQGPAAVWSDGTAVHAWHGRVVPRSLTTGDGWPVARILATYDSDLRTCAAQRLGWDRLLADPTVERLGTDAPDPANPGQVLSLFRLRSPGSTLHVLRCTDVPSGRDGSRRAVVLGVPTDLDDPTEAAAWTYGVTADAYRAALRRT